MNKIKEFWEWFLTVSDEYREINNLNDAEEIEKLLDKLLYHLHIYCEKLYFEIGGDDSVYELIITAEGNKKFFSKVVDLVNAAPVLPGWEIIAFKPAQGINFTTEYDDILFTPTDMWFDPLYNGNYPKELGIKVFIPNMTFANKESYVNGVYKVLDTILGEKVFAMDIKYLEVGDLPMDPLGVGLIKLIELPAYINWFKNKYGE